MTNDAENDGFGRRGALAALLGTAAVATTAGSAKAASRSNVRKTAGSSSSKQTPMASPVNATIASPARTGYAYRTFWYADFLPIDPSADQRNFEGAGAWSTSPLQASCEIPAGALLRDLEWYVANAAGGPVLFYAAIWTPADGYITIFAPASIPSGSGELTATRVETVGANWGPYPDGSKIVLYAPTTASCLLNGVRVGFSNGGLEHAVRSVPLKIYDSTVTGGKFIAGQSRTITIDSVAVGTTAVILRVIATDSITHGSVKVFPANLAEPDIGSSSIIADGEGIGEVTVAISAARQIKVKPSRAAHIRIDLVGWLR